MDTHHVWSLRTTIDEKSVGVPITDYAYLCTRIGEMALSNSVTRLEIRRDGEPYRIISVCNPAIFHCYGCEQDFPISKQSTVSSATCQMCADKYADEARAQNEQRRFQTARPELATPFMIEGK